MSSRAVKVKAMADALERVATELRKGGVTVDPGTSISLEEIRVRGLSVACHRTHEGPLHICVPADGPCREVGPADRPAETAAVIRGILARATPAE